MRKLSAVLLLMVLVSVYAPSKAPSSYRFKSFEMMAMDDCYNGTGDCLPPT